MPVNTGDVLVISKYRGDIPHISRRVRRNNVTTKEVVYRGDLLVKVGEIKFIPKTSKNVAPENGGYLLNCREMNTGQWQSLYLENCEFKKAGLWKIFKHNLYNLFRFRKPVI